MKKYSSCFLFLAIILSILTLSLHSAHATDCKAPAKSINAQINDFCFLQFETDDIAHPGVQSCVDALSAIPDTCENRIKIKAYRCSLLKEKNSLEKEMTDEKCIYSVDTEGNFARGCEYPFDGKCRKVLNNKD